MMHRLYRIRLNSPPDSNRCRSSGIPSSRKLCRLPELSLRICSARARPVPVSAIPLLLPWFPPIIAYAGIHYYILSPALPVRSKYARGMSIPALSQHDSGAGTRLILPGHPGHPYVREETGSNTPGAINGSGSFIIICSGNCVDERFTCAGMRRSYYQI
jgi:hypothetical protein